MASKVIHHLEALVSRVFSRARVWLSDTAGSLMRHIASLIWRFLSWPSHQMMHCVVASILFPQNSSRQSAHAMLAMLRFPAFKKRPDGFFYDLLVTRLRLWLDRLPGFHLTEIVCVYLPHLKDCMDHCQCSHVMRECSCKVLG